MLTFITILQAIIFFGYVYYIYNRYGKLTSISASTYKLPRREQWKFIGFLGAVGLLNVFQEMGMYGVLTMAGLWFTGITINHASSAAHTDKVHAVGTIGAILAAFIGLWSFHGMWIPTVLLVIATALLYKHKYFIWWIEIVAVALVLGSYLFR